MEEVSGSSPLGSTTVKQKLPFSRMVVFALASALRQMRTVVEAAAIFFAFHKAKNREAGSRVLSARKQLVAENT